MLRQPATGQLAVREQQRSDHVHLLHQMQEEQRGYHETRLEDGARGPASGYHETRLEDGARGPASGYHETRLEDGARGPASGYKLFTTTSDARGARSKWQRITHVPTADGAATLGGTPRVPDMLRDLSMMAQRVSAQEAIAKTAASQELGSLVGARRMGYNPSLAKYEQRMPKSDALYLARWDDSHILPYEEDYVPPKPKRSRSDDSDLLGCGGGA
ncbi:hypothetical protein T484DRAFT_1898748, partial [Baffinella frigidus]